MNSPKRLTAILVILIASLHGLTAANFVVEVGSSIQSKVTLAQPGDVVIARGGTYPEQNVTIDKPIRLTREKNTTVRIGGSVTYRDVNSTVTLRDFEIDLNGNGRLVISNCSRIGLENLTKLPQGLSISNSTVVIRDCNFTGSIALDANSTVEMINSQCAGLDVNGSVFSSENSLLGSVSADTNSTLSLVDSNLTTGLFSGGSAFLRNTGASADVTFLRCDWEAHKSLFKGNLDSNESHSKLIRSTVEKAFRHNHEQALGQNLDCVVFQSTVGRVNGDVLLSKAHRTWVAYSELHQFYSLRNTRVTLLSNKIYNDRKDCSFSVLIDGNMTNSVVINNEFLHSTQTGSYFIDKNETVTVGRGSNYYLAKTFNLGGGYVSQVSNEFRNSSSTTNTNGRVRYEYLDGSYSDVGRTRSGNSGNLAGARWESFTFPNPWPSKIVLSIKVYINPNGQGAYWYRDGYEKNTRVEWYSNSIEISNPRHFFINNNLFINSYKVGNSIRISGTPSDQSQILGNAFWRTNNDWQVPAVSAPSGVICRNNYFQSQAQSTTGSLAHFDNVFGADPGFNDPANGDWTLSPTSILKNAGPTEAQYNDHDGTRNDIGMFGGHSYDVNGSTTTKPVVLSADQSIRRIGLAENVPLIIKSRAAVSTP